jgi:2-succinyl-6-hydroxy-2,4-cyclohexadiene-1-carboxylate synthase
MTLIPVNGINLNVEVSGDGPSLLMLHGFTGDSSTWDAFVDNPDLAAYKLVRIDVIGHGKSDSPADTERYSMKHAVEDILAVADHLGIDRFALLGYSMGGRLALHVALAARDRLWGLVLESASPGIPDLEAREKRRVDDERLADSIDRNGIEIFIDRWQDQPLFASQKNLPEEVQARQRATRVAQSPIGLGNSLRGMGAGTQEFLLPLLPDLKVPALFQAGGLDSRYVILGEAMQKQMQDSTLQVIEGAGHAAHLEQPEEFLRGVTVFLAVTIMTEMGRQHVEEQHGYRME